MESNAKYLVIPGCTDLNRGDQALTWETVRLLEGDAYMLSGGTDDATRQSKDEGLLIARPLLKHPSRIFKETENIRYGALLKLKWGMVGVRDILVYGGLLTWPNSGFFRKLLSKEDLQTLELFNEASSVFVKGGGVHSCLWCNYRYLLRFLCVIPYYDSAKIG